MADPVSFLLDTSALLAHSRQETGWEQVQAIFRQEDAVILLASPSLTEFARRLRDLGAGQEEVDDILGSYRMLFSEVVPIDESVALTAFDIGCRATSRLPLTDALIAAAAKSRDACLVHRDDHFLAIPDDVLLQLDIAGAP